MVPVCFHNYVRGENLAKPVGLSSDNQCPVREENHNKPNMGELGVQQKWLCSQKYKCICCISSFLPTCFWFQEIEQA